MKKILTLFISLLITFTVMPPCFCDETFYVDIPDLSDVDNVFEYTGNEIVYEIPDSEYYTVGGNVQTEVGEYDAIINLNKQNYVWRNGSTSDLFYHFSIEKANYDLSDVVFADRVVIADGSSFSLQATNLPDSISVQYSAQDISEPGSYLIIAMLNGDNNYYQVEPLTATLHILEKPTDNNVISISLGSVSGYLPYQTDLSFNLINKNSDRYKEISDVLVSNNVSSDDILDIACNTYTYNGINIECHEEVTYNITNPEKDRVSVYAVDENLSCRKLNTKINDNILTFTTDVSSDLVFVRDRINYVLYIGIAIVAIAIIVLIVLAIIKKIKNKGGSQKKFRPLQKKNNSSRKTSLYKKSNS